MKNALHIESFCMGSNALIETLLIRKPWYYLPPTGPGSEINFLLIHLSVQSITSLLYISLLDW